MKKILFSAAGTSDPVREYNDGPLLHIIRNYRPDEIYVLLAKEIGRLEDKDNRFELMEKSIKENWGGIWEGYSPQITLIRLDELENPANIDLSYEPITQELYKIASDNPEAEILLNLSSGTPAFQIILSNETLNTRYKMRGIVVSSPEKKSGTTPRTNKEDYDPTKQLKENKDSTENSQRCYEPKNLYLHRSQNIDRIKKLLENYDYSSMLILKEDLPSSVIPLVEHMEKRTRLESNKARVMAKKANVDFDLYPTKKVDLSSPVWKREEALLEYFLNLKTLVETSQYAEFLFRLNPFLVTLDQEILAGFTEKRFSLPYEDLYEVKKDAQPFIRYSLLNERAAPLYKKCKADETIGKGPKITLYPYSFDPIFQFFKKDLGNRFLNTHNKIVQMNKEKRNPLAHKLINVTLEDFDEFDLTPDEIIDFLEETMEKHLRTVDPERFEVYHRVNDYILEKLDQYPISK